MSSRLIAALSGNLQELMAAELKAARHAVTTGVRDATDGLKSELRSQITGAGLGARLANTWRGEVYPKGRESLGAAGLVYSRAPVVVAAHDEGALIRSKNGFWLSIPLPSAGTGPRGKRITRGFGSACAARDFDLSTEQVSRHSWWRTTNVQEQASGAVSQPHLLQRSSQARGLSVCRSSYWCLRLSSRRSSTSIQPFNAGNPSSYKTSSPTGPMNEGKS